MDSYTIDFRGVDLDFDQMVQSFEGFEVLHFNRRGEDTLVINGKRRKKTTDGYFTDTSITFSSNHQNLLEFLDDVSHRLTPHNQSQIEETIVFCLMERDGQINGELSPKEMAKLCELKAHFCWSVIFCCEECCPCPVQKENKL